MKRLNSVEEKISLAYNIMMKKKIWIGHILRDNGLLKDVIEGRGKESAWEKKGGYAV